MSDAALVLAKGEIFEGVSLGATGLAAGEVVFNTAITGYQEILTDPSYARQIVTLTHPHIGNTGTNAEDEESDRIDAAGLIVRDVPRRMSSWRNACGLTDYLSDRNVVGIGGLDTRRLTRLLRDQGSQNGCIVAAKEIGPSDIDHARQVALDFPGLAGMDLAKEVTTSEAYEWRQGSWQLGRGYRNVEETRFHVVAFDFGVKRNILRMLADRRCRLTVVPAKTTAAEVLRLKPDGVFLSNGPGDPEPCDYAIEAIRALLSKNLPVFGICLGLQLLGLAAGMKTMKMGHGHHGANHPVRNLMDNTVLITSQNHGFCIDDSSLPQNVTVTH
ncbi:MAG: glutamine-hydrolyzing carbamoyl-phosphate synthase small subunit, partial [Pseudomonadota bacterium]|nr:glutamine-hydrolyzing carbamoyl-phosphate synthase small subunit [Pseudomonadota bacterium]